jgi:hypothetical protein
MKLFYTKEYVLMCFYLAAVIKWQINQFEFWLAMILWCIVINMYRNSIINEIEKENGENG